MTPCVRERKVCVGGEEEKEEEEEEEGGEGEGGK